jgi:hypothetical protein
MPRPIHAIEITSFDGGWNLDADQFKLKDNETPEIYNMMLLRDGSATVRKGMAPWGSGPWGANYAGNSYFFQSSTGVRQMLESRQSDHTIQYGTGGAWASIGQTTGATPHEADFQTWINRVYCANGKGQVGCKWDGTTRTALTASATGAWQNNYDTPTGTHQPKAEFIERHADRMWVGYTNEDGTDFPLRIRYSHFNQPESWHQDDYIDLPEGGGKITGLISFKDTLIIFKEKQIWAIYGYDPDQFNKVNLTQTMGVLHVNFVGANEGRVYFYDLALGVWSWDGKKFNDHFEKLRPAIDNGWITGAALDRATLNVLDRQVFVGLPFLRTGVASLVYASFVFDETVGKYGAWTQIFTRGGYGPRHVVHYIASDGTKIPLCRIGSGWMLQMNARNDAKDDIGDGLGPGPFSNGISTKWYEAAAIGQKANWRAPDYILGDQDADSLVKVLVYTDYDEANAKRGHSLIQTAAVANSLVWNVGNWNEKNWGARTAGSLIIKGASIGNARAVRLVLSGSFFEEGDGVHWSLNAIVHKVTPRNLR